MRRLLALLAYIAALGVVLLAANSTLEGGRLQPIPSPTAALLTATPAPSVSASAEPAASPDTPDSVASDVQDVVGRPADEVGAALLAIAKFLLIPVAVWLAYQLLRRLLSALRQRPIVVIDDLVDATGIESIGKSSTGLSQVMREEVGLQIARANERYRISVAKRSKFARPDEWITTAPPPLNATHDDLATLVAAVKDASPEPGKSVLSALAALFPAVGTKVSGYLRQVDERSGRLGVAFRFADLSDPRRTTAFQLDEGVPIPLASLVAADDASPGLVEALRGAIQLVQSQFGRLGWLDFGSLDAGPGEPSSQDSPKDAESQPEARALVEIARIYERSNYREIAKAKYEAALEKDPTSVAARDGLGRILSESTPLDHADMLIRACGPFVALALVRANRLSAIRPNLLTLVDEFFYPPPPTQRRWNVEHAMIHNYIGARMATEADSAGRFSVGLRLGDWELHAAMALCPRWYLPYENAGDV